ncbi:MAG: TolC family protein, partial [Spirochaetaceae bacterium]|nr:TolC family protein [Spirochaetaceae bacterium]
MILFFDGARWRKPAACRRGIKIPFRESLCRFTRKGKPWFGPLLLAGLFLIFIGPAFGEAETRVISPDEAVALAVKNNLTLESSRLSVETKKRKSDLSWNQFIPSVTVGGSLSADNKA